MLNDSILIPSEILVNGIQFRFSNTANNSEILNRFLKIKAINNSAGFKTFAEDAPAII